MSKRPLVAMLLPLLVVSALVGTWLATRDAPESPPPVEEARDETAFGAETPGPERAAEVPPPPVAARAPQSVPLEPDPPAEEVVPLEDLLRVPEADAFPMLPEGTSEPGSPAIGAEEQRGIWPSDRIRIEASRQEDKNAINGKTEREQVEAGASVRVDESTSVRGRVRIERDPDEASEVERETAPIIGIEKRF